MQVFTSANSPAELYEKEANTSPPCFEASISYFFFLFRSCSLQFQPIVGSTAKISLTRDLSCTWQLSVRARKLNSQRHLCAVDLYFSQRPSWFRVYWILSYDNWIGVHVLALFNKMLYNHHWSWYLVSKPQRPISNVVTLWPVGANFVKNRPKATSSNGILKGGPSLVFTTILLLPFIQPWCIVDIKTTY